jgi:hypothetical protein
MDDIRDRVETIEAEMKYVDDTPEDLYMKMLEDSSPEGGDFPGAADEYLRRYRAHQRQQERRRQHRRDHFGLAGEPESEGGE